MKSYCVQNNGDCKSCSLVNYGKDCQNNPISQPLRKGTKMDRAMAAYDGFAGPLTVAAVRKHIGQELSEQLTGRHYGLVMSAVNRAFMAGRASTGAEIIDDNCVWINCLDRAIEWMEDGAEYEPYEETHTDEYGVTHTTCGKRKVKEGKLIARFADKREKAE